MTDVDVNEIDIADAETRLDAGDRVFVDIRDPGSFGAAHIPGAVSINDGGGFEGWRRQMPVEKPE